MRSGLVAGSPCTTSHSFLASGAACKRTSSRCVRRGRVTANSCTVAHRSPMSYSAAADSLLTTAPRPLRTA